LNASEQNAGMVSDRLCSQCGSKSPIVQVALHLLCVDCHLKFQQAQRIAQDELARTLNWLAAVAESQVGLNDTVLPRIEITKPIVHSGPMALNNPNVQDSIVGVINPGEIERLDLAMSDIRAGGNKELSEVLQQLTQAVLDATDIADAQRKVLEHISFLATQAILPKRERQASVGKIVTANLERILNASASLATLVPLAIP
jgi:hypothetical protein